MDYWRRGRNEDHEDLEPFPHTQEPFAHTQEPFAHTQEPLSQTQEPFSHTHEPFPHAHEPFSHTEQPFSYTQAPKHAKKGPAFKNGDESNYPIDPVYEFRDERGGRRSRVFSHPDTRAFETKQAYYPNGENQHFPCKRLMIVILIIVLLLLIIGVVAGSVYYIYDLQTSDAKKPIGTTTDTMPASPTTRPDVSENDAILVGISMTFDLPYIPAYNDATSTEYQLLEGAVQDAVNIAILERQTNLDAVYESTVVQGFRSGSVISDLVSSLISLIGTSPNDLAIIQQQIRVILQAAINDPEGPFRELRGVIQGLVVRRPFLKSLATTVQATTPTTTRDMESTTIPTTRPTTNVVQTDGSTTDEGQTTVPSTTRRTTTRAPRPTSEPGGPNLDCPEDISRTLREGTFDMVITWTDPIPVDDDGVKSLETDYEPGSRFNIGVTTVTYTAVDNKDFTSYCSFDVIIIDNEKPKITCPDDVTRSTNLHSASAYVVLPTPEVSDNSGIFTVESDAPIHFTIRSSWIVTFTARDESNNVATCTVTVTVIDTEQPILRCPEDFEVSTDPSSPTATVNIPDPQTLSDNSGLEVTLTGNVPTERILPIGETVIILTATDVFGNMAECNFTVTVRDTEAPTITCPDNQQLVISPDITMGTILRPRPRNVNDNAGGNIDLSNTWPSNNKFDVGSTEVTFTATDSSGNEAMCTITVTVTVFRVRCPDDITRNTDPNQPTATVDDWPDPTFVNSPGGDITVQDDSPEGNLFPIGSTVVTITAIAPTDRAICIFTVTVNDEEDPELTCPEDFTRSYNSEVGGALLYWAPTLSQASDNSGEVTVTYDPVSGSILGVIGENVINVMAEDSSGNQVSCTFMVDVQAPEVATEGTMTLTTQFVGAFNDLSSPESQQVIADFENQMDLVLGSEFGGVYGGVEVTELSPSQGSPVIMFTIFWFDPNIVSNDVMTAVNDNILANDGQFGDLETSSSDPVTISDPMTVITLSCPEDIISEVDDRVIPMPDPLILQNTNTLNSNWPVDDTFPLGDTVITYTAGDTDTVMCQFTVAVAALPNSQLTYTTSVSSTPEGPFSDPCDEDNKITVLTGQNLAVTCRAEDTYPFSTVSIYKGDGGDLSSGDEMIGSESTFGSDVMQDGDGFDTEITREITNPQFSTNGDIISCVSRSTIAGVLREAVSCGALDFIAEVKTTNMKMFVSTSANTPGPEVDYSNPYPMIDNTMYYVDCVVEGAIPAATITADINTVSLTSATQSTAFPDITSGSLTSRRSTNSFTFVADSAMCNQMLRCGAGNPANAQLNDFDTNNPLIQYIGVQVRVAFGPGNPVLVLDASPDASSGNDDADGNNVAADVNGNTNAILIEGLAYDFVCTVAAGMSDPEANIRWRLYKLDGTQIGVDKLDTSGESVPDCSSNEYKGEYTLSAMKVTFADLQCGYLECTAYNSVGESASVRITFQIWKLPSSSIGGVGIELAYKEMGAADSSYIDLVDSQDQALAVDITYTFRCIVKDVSPVGASPVPVGGPAVGLCSSAGLSSVSRDVVNIDFYYHNEARDIGISNNDETATFNGNEFYDLTDTYNRLITTGDNCPSNIVCRADVNANGTPTPSTSDVPSITVPIIKIVPVAGVDIFLLQVGSGAAALSATPTTDLTANEQLDPAATLVVIDGMGYALEAATSNLIEPNPNWNWDRVDGSGTFEADLQDTPSSGVVDCTPAISTNTLTSTSLPTIDFDTYNGKRINVAAYTTGATQEEYVQLDVRAEVKTTNMKMYVSTSANTPGTEVDYSSPYYMVDNTMYYVDCVVEDAVPAPTITADINTASLTSATQSTAFPDITSGSLSTRRSTNSFTYLAAAANCDDMLRCGAGNAANQLLNSFDNSNLLTQYIGVQVRVEFGPGNPVLVLDAGSGNDDEDGDNVAADINGNTNAILIEGLAYEFDCTVAAGMSDPEANIRWRLYKLDGTQIGVDKLDTSGESLPDCSSNEYKGDNTLSAMTVTFADLQCGYLECTAYNSVGESASVRITFQIWKLPSSSIGGVGIELAYKEMGAADSTYTDLVDGQDQDLYAGVTYTFRCIVKDVSPVGASPVPVGGPAVGLCNAGLSSVSRDVVNIDFYYHDEARDIGMSNNDETATFNGNEFYDIVDTYNRLITTGDNCPSNIVCRADVNANGTPTPSTSDVPSITVPINKVVPVDDVDIFLLQVGSGAAALSTTPTTDLTANELQLAPAATLVVIDGMGYALEAATSNLVEPSPAWNWDRVDGSGTFEDDLQDTPSSGVVDCTPAIYTDTLTSTNLPTIDFDTYNGKRINVAAYITGATQEEYVQMDVRAEVKTTNMKMFVSTSANTPGTEVDYSNPYPMIDNTMYYVDCVVEGAVPAPTITADIATVGISDATQSTAFQDNASGLLSTRRFTSSFTYLAAAANCGDMLRCGSGNMANQLLNSFDNINPLKQYKEVEVSVAFGPGNPVLVLDAAGLSGNDDEDGDNVAADINGNTNAILIEGLAYDFVCTVAAGMSDPEANIRWRLYKLDGTQIGVDKLDTSGESLADCSSNEYKGEYTLSTMTVTFADLQCGYLECTAYNSAGESASVKITFQIWKLPSSSTGGVGIDLAYKVMGADDNTYADLVDGQEQPLAIDVTYTFRCTVKDVSPVGASPAPVEGPAEGVCDAGLSSVSRDVVNIDFYYHNEARNDGISNDDEIATFNPISGLYDLIDTYNRLIMAGDNCPSDIICRADVNADGTPSSSISDVPSITVPLNRIVPAASVDITLLQLGSGVAALSATPTTHITADQLLSSASTVVVINEMTYLLQAATSNAVDPDPTWNWDRVDGSGTFEDDLQDTPSDGVVDCTPAVDTDALTSTNLPTIGFDTYNGKRIKVAADIMGVSQEEYVQLDVRAEVKTTNMKMFVSTSANTPGTEVDYSNPYPMIDNTMYYVDCVIEGAVPAPTITADINTVSLTSAASQSTAFPDITSGSLSTRRFTSSFTYLAAAANCGDMLRCGSGNMANQLLNSFDNSNPLTQYKEVEVLVAFGPGNPVLVLDTAGPSGNDDADGNNVAADVNGNTNAILIEGLAYDFVCTVAAGMSDPEANIRWRLYKLDGTQIGDDKLDTSGESVPDCSSNEYKGEYTLSPMTVTFADLQCGYLECTAVNSAGERSVKITFQIWKLPSSTIGGVGIELAYKAMGAADSTYTDLVDGQDQALAVDITYTFRCTVKDVNPVEASPAPVGGPGLGACSTGGVSSILRDVVNIDFYYHDDPRDSGTSIDDETATYNGNELYDLTDTYDRLITAGDNCPSNIVCRADVNADGTASPSLSDVPSITVSINRIVPIAAVDISLLQSGSGAAALLATPTTDIKADLQLASPITVVVINGMTYLFQASTSNAIESKAAWNWDRVNGICDSSDTMEANLQDTPSSGVVDCTPTIDTNDLTSTSLPTIGFDTYNGKRIKVEADVTGAPQDECVLLDVRAEVKTTNIKMFVSTSANTPGTEVDYSNPYPMVASTMYYVDCVIEAAVPAPTITADIATVAISAAIQSTAFLDITSGLLSTRRSTSSFTYIAAAANCGDMLRCGAGNMANQLLNSFDNSNPPMQYKEVEVLVALPITAVDISLLQSGSGAAALLATPTTDIKADLQLASPRTVVVINDMTYLFQASTSNAIDSKAAWNWDRFDGTCDSSDTVEANLQDTPSSGVVDCTSTIDTNDLTSTSLPTIGFDTYNGKRIKVEADVTGAPQDECVLLDVRAEVKATNMKMFVSTSANTPGTEVDYSNPYPMVANTMYFVDCVVEGAVPAPTITADINTVGISAATQSTAFLDITSGLLSTRRSTSSFTYIAAAANCGHILRCGAGNAANQLLNSFDNINPPTQYKGVEVRVAVPIAAVDISLLQSGSGAAALLATPTTDIKADLQLASPRTVVVINDMTYLFQASTSNAIDSKAAWNWDRFDGTCDSSDTVEANLQDTPSSGVVDCTSTIDTNDLTSTSLPTIGFDTYNGKRIKVEADVTGAPQDECVLLDVRAEAKTTNMKMFVSTSANTPGTEVDYSNPYPMVANTMYFVDCVVEGAVPAPTITADINTVGISAATQSTAFLDITSGLLSTRRSTSSFTYIAAAANCGHILRCGAGNAANQLLNSFDNSNPLIQYKGVEVRVAFGPGNPVLVLDAGSGNDDIDGDNVAADVNGNTNAILIEGLAYDFDCTVAAGMSDPDANIRWRLYKSDGTTQIGVDELDTTGESLADCIPNNEYKGEYRLSAVTFADLQCGYLECTAVNSAGESASVKITFQIWTVPGTMTLNFKAMGDPVSSYMALIDGQTIALAVGTTYDFQCTVSDVFPIANIAAAGSVGLCNAGLSSQQRDVLNIDFFVNGVLDAGVQGATEVIIYQNPFFDLTDTYTHTIVSGDCGQTLVCSADHFPGPGDSASPMASYTPSITITITC